MKQLFPCSRSKRVLSLLAASCQPVLLSVAGSPANSNDWRTQWATGTSPVSKNRDLPAVGLPPEARAPGAAAGAGKRRMAISVRGRVTNEKGEGLPGVSVLLKGTTTGTATGQDGSYSLTVPDGNGTLVFSFIGYSTEEVPINNRTTIDVALVPDLKALSEVVVVGYGTQQKREVTGSVATLEARQLEDLPVGQFAQKIQGRIAGVQINQGTGRPGEGLSFRIRGAASIGAGNSPLFVVDGLPITGDISNINPDEIQSYSVLKDASAGSLYGSRAANGVVLITTKKAAEGKTEIGFNAGYGFQQVPQQGRPEVLNAREFARYKKEYYEDQIRYEGRTEPVPEEFQNPEQYGEGTDWYDEILQRAPIQNYSLSVATNQGKFSTAIVAGYFKQQGVVLNTDYERYSLRANSEYKINDFIRIGANVAPTYYTRQNFYTDGSFSIIGSALMAPPTVSPYNPDGTLKVAITAPGMLSGTNWVRALRERQDRFRGTRLLATGYGEVDFLRDFRFRTSVGIDLEGRNQKVFTPSTAGGSVFEAPPVRASGAYNSRFYYSWLSENTLTYTRTFNQSHHLEALAGYAAQAYREEYSNLTGTDFPDDAVSWIDAAATRNGGSGTADWSLLSLIGRVNYNFRGKYLLSAAVRRDGSSRFGVDNRWGTFPSISAGWTVSDENFAKAIPQVSFLKLRASYGLVGNNNIGNYTQYANISTANYSFNDVISQGRAPSSLGNPRLNWETTRQLDLGLDLGLLNNRVNLVFDYYRKNTDDLLYQVDIPRASGFFSVQSNIGAFRLWGYEVAVNSLNLVGDFKWSTDFNISFNRSKALKLSTNDAPVGGYNDYNDYWRTAVGQPIGQFYGYVFDGVYLNQADLDASPKHATSEVGTVKYRDLNGDGVITSADKDFIGNPTPKFVFGLNNAFTYRNFDLNVLVTGAYGGKVMNGQLEYTENLDGVFNVATYVKDRWRSEENPGAGEIPRTKSGTTAIQRATNSRWVSDASYATLKNVTLGYTLPLPANKYLAKARFYATIQQALVLTNYEGANPEASINGLDGLRQGLDIANYPVPRTYSLGVNLNF